MNRLRLLQTYFTCHLKQVISFNMGSLHKGWVCGFQCSKIKGLLEMLFIQQSTLSHVGTFQLYVLNTQEFSLVTAIKEIQKWLGYSIPTHFKTTRLGWAFGAAIPLCGTPVSHNACIPHRVPGSGPGCTSESSCWCIPRKAAGWFQSLGSYSHTGDPDQLLGFWLLSGPSSAVVGI